MTEIVGPELIRRIDDGQMLRRNADNTYSFVDSEMGEPYKYTFERLMDDPRCKGAFELIPDEEPEFDFNDLLPYSRYNTYAFVGIANANAVTSTPTYDNENPSYVGICGNAFDPDVPGSIASEAQGQPDVQVGDPPYQVEPGFDHNGRWIAASMTAETYARIMTDATKPVTLTPDHLSQAMKLLETIEPPARPEPIHPNAYADMAALETKTILCVKPTKEESRSLLPESWPIRPNSSHYIKRLRIQTEADPLFEEIKIDAEESH